MESNDSEKVTPLPIALTPKRTLLLGAGAVAKQKHEVLKKFGWSVVVVAKEIKNPYFNTLQVDSDLPELSQFDVVVDATGDEGLGEYLHVNRKKFGYLLNVVDDVRYCDFYFGAIYKDENLSVMVSSNGASPIVAQKVRDKIAKILPKNIGKFLDILKANRPKKLTTSQKDEISQEANKKLGKVFLVGCGPSSLESLTLRALQTFELLDVALIDNLIGKEIWELLENLGVECVSVGKQKGAQSFSQESINELMLSYAKQGKVVGRLKGGDPAIFGRVWEEGAYLKAHDVEVELISGITSSLSGALSSGIVPTIRGVSQGVLVVSAHLRESVFNDEWIQYAKNSPYTIVVMMAYSFADKILQSAAQNAVDLNTPCAFVSHVDRPTQKAVFGTLAKIEEMAKRCDKPAILIIGKAVGEASKLPYHGERIVL